MEKQNMTKRDITDIQPAEIAGDFRKAAHIAMLAAEARQHLPRWTGGHARVPGNYPVAEVTPDGTLLLTNEVTMQDVAGLISWLCRTSGLDLVSLMPCGHPTTASEAAPLHSDGWGMGDEPPTNRPHHCKICRQLERLAAADERHGLLQTELNTVRSAGSQARHEADALRERLKTATDVCQERTARISFLEAELDKLQKRLKRRPIKGKGSKPKPKPRKR